MHSSSQPEIGTCTASATQAQSLSGGLSDASVEFALAAMRGREQELMSRPGVIGIGVSEGGDNQREAAIVVYIDATAQVSTKLPKTISGKIRRVELRARENAPSEAGEQSGAEWRDDQFPELRG